MLQHPLTTPPLFFPSCSQKRRRITQNKTQRCLNQMNAWRTIERRGLPDYLGQSGGEGGGGWERWRSSHHSPSWQTDSQAGGCLNPTHMGHLTVIKSCGIQPEPVKLINSLVLPPSRRERPRATPTCVIKFRITLRATCK